MTLRVENREDGSGTRVRIVRGQVANVGELSELLERLPALTPEGAFFKKGELQGQANGRRIRVLLAFEFYGEGLKGRSSSTSSSEIGAK